MSCKNEADALRIQILTERLAASSLRVQIAGEMEVVTRYAHERAMREHCEAAEAFGRDSKAYEEVVQ